MASNEVFRPLPLRERVGRGVAPVSSTLRTRRLVVPGPPHPDPLPQGEREPEVPSAKRVIANPSVLRPVRLGKEEPGSVTNHARRWLASSLEKRRPTVRQFRPCRLAVCNSPTIAFHPEASLGPRALPSSCSQDAAQSEAAVRTGTNRNVGARDPRPVDPRGLKSDRTKPNSQ